MIERESVKGEIDRKVERALRPHQTHMFFDRSHRHVVEMPTANISSSLATNRLRRNEHWRWVFPSDAEEEEANRAFLECGHEPGGDW